MVAGPKDSMSRGIVMSLNVRDKNSWQGSGQVMIRTDVDRATLKHLIKSDR